MPGQQQQQQSKHQHRASGLRQSNKKNKRSRASKRSRALRAGAGKVATATTTVSGPTTTTTTSLASQSKANRRNHQQQLRDAKRQALLRQRRGLVQQQQPSSSKPTTTTKKQLKTSVVPPRLVGIVGLSANPAALEERVRGYLMAHASRVIHHPPAGDAGADADATCAAVTCQYEAHHKKEGRALTLRTASSLNNNNNNEDADATLWAVLDLARVCDSLVFVIDGDQYYYGPSAQQQPTTGTRPEDAGMVGMEICGFGNDEEHDPVNKSFFQNNNSNNTTSQQQQLDRLITERADRLLSALKAQGLPTPLTVLASTTSATEDNEDDDDDDHDDHMTMQSVKSVRRSKHKRQLELQRWVRRLATTEFGPDHDKVLEVDLSYNNSNNNNNNSTTTTASTTTPSSSSSLIRTLCTMSCAPAKWVSQVPRAYLVADSVQYQAGTGLLQLQGYIRGRVPWDVHALVHVPGSNIGTVTCRSIAAATAPLSLLRKSARNKMNSNSSTTQMMTMTTTTPEEEEENLIVLADPTQRESLDMYASPDALEGEQNLIGFDNDYDGDDAEDVTQQDDPTGLARPAGWSDYQSAWLDAVDGNDDDDPGQEKDTGELAKELNRRKSPTGASSSLAGATTLGDNNNNNNDPMTDTLMDEANQVSDAERRALRQERRQKQQSEEAEFPDEVQVDEDVKARERFARYRSLQSFRKSHWDPKENLPDSYASIYHLASFTQTQRSVMKDMKELMREADAAGGNFFGKTLSGNKSDSKTSTTVAEDVAMDMQSGDEKEEEEDFLEGCVPSGSYVTLTLENVSPDAVNALTPNSLLTAVTLLSHENKVSVLHMGLSQTAGCDETTTDPVKSKDVLTFRCGWRTWQARPVFSQNNLNCDKHKFERFLPTGGAFFAASVFGPITYTPCPVLVFRNTENLSSNNNNNDNTRCQLVAVGSMLGADADRIVVKRIILTGYPVRVHKRHATVKYMFYDPEDVKWFKPAGLYTKHGLQGNILQSVGEHGTMKCLFNAPIQQHDTVCLPLYKRIYPKYAELNNNDLVDQEANSGNGGTVGGGTMFVKQGRSMATCLVVR